MEIILEAGRTEKNYWRDLWRYRELFYFLAWRDILVRYKQTAIGITWAVLRPVLVMSAFIFLRKATNQPSLGVPEPIFVLSALLPWLFFANALSESSNSLVGNSNLISKVYFPRMIVPTSSVVVCLIDFIITFLILMGFMIYFQFYPTWKFLALIGFSAIAFFAALGPGLLITALNVKYRDFRYIIPFIVQFGIFVTPVMYSSDQLLERFGNFGLVLYALNPMSGVVDGFRWAICGMGELYWPGFAISISLLGLFFFLGIRYFRKVEKTFADVI